MNPFARTQCSYVHSPPNNDKEIPPLQHIWFQLTNAGEEDVDDSYISDNIQDDFYDNVDNNMDDVYGGSGVTVTTRTPYEFTTAAAQHEDRRRDVDTSKLFDVDPTHKRWIPQAMLDGWGIYSPPPWQNCAIHNIAFIHAQLVYLNAKTGSGKSAVPLTVGSLQGGVTLSIAPLVGLDSNQVSKSHNEDNYVESYHFDEHRGLDGHVLRDRLLSITDEEGTHVLICLYSSPQSLQVGTFWVECLTTLTS